MEEKSNYFLVAMVAIVAIVGIIFMFSSNLKVKSMEMKSSMPSSTASKGENNLAGQAIGGFVFGNVDVINCDFFGGWVKDSEYDGGIPVAATMLHVVNGLLIAPDFAAQDMADKYRSDLCNYPFIGCNHAFHHVWTAQEKQWLREGQTQISVYSLSTGLSSNGQQQTIIGPCP